MRLNTHEYLENSEDGYTIYGYTICGVKSNNYEN